MHLETSSEKKNVSLKCLFYLSLKIQSLGLAWIGCQFMERVDRFSMGIPIVILGC